MNGTVHRLRPPAHPWRREWPIGLVVLGVAVSLAVVASNHFRRGSLLLSVSLIAAFALRLVLTDRTVGLLAVRSKTVDLIVLGLLAGGMTVMSLWVPPPS